MAKRPPTTEPHVERPGPAEFRDPFVRREFAKAAIWLGLALLIVGIVVLAQPLLLIVGGAIFAVFLDGGVRRAAGGGLLGGPHQIEPRVALGERAARERWVHHDRVEQAGEL